MYLLQLAQWGFDKGLALHEPKLGISQNGLADQVALLLGREDQGRVYRWLLRNPNGPQMSEQVASLEADLQGAKDPLRAAALVLETISSRMTAARV